jgi:hypothetical protein
MKDLLADAHFEQPHTEVVVVFLAGLAAIEHVRTTSGLSRLQSSRACVGWGGGEYASLVFAGALALSDALSLLRAHCTALVSSAAAELADDGDLAATSAVQEALEGVTLREPRVAIFSGRSGQRYRTGGCVRQRFASEACRSGPTSQAHFRRLKTALLQRGFIVSDLLPPAEAV